MYRYKKSSLPVVVYRRRRRDAPHYNHNGAWKVAYADFVTAMMSLFLLLWLLSVTTSTQRTAISSYFDPTATSVTKSGAGGVLGGKSIIEPGAEVSPETATGVHAPFPGVPEADQRHDDDNNRGEAPLRTNPDAQKAGGNGAAGQQADAAKEQAEREDRDFRQAEASLKQAIQSVPELQPLARNLIVDETQEGMRIQLVDQEGASMFPLGSTEMYDQTRKLLGLIEQSLAGLPNKVSIRGHTDATPYRGGADHYNNWDLSSDRANAARRALEAGGLDPNRVVEVIGKADKDLLFPDKPMSPENRRISIVLLREAPPPAATGN